MEVHFVEEPADALKCVICLEVATDPVQHEKCGKLLCSECLDRLGRGKPCPNCRTNNSQYFTDHKSEAIPV